MLVGKKKIELIGIGDKVSHHLEIKSIANLQITVVIRQQDMIIVGDRVIIGVHQEVRVMILGVTEVIILKDIDHRHLQTDKLIIMGMMIVRPQEIGTIEVQREHQREEPMIELQESRRGMVRQVIQGAVVI